MAPGGSRVRALLLRPMPPGPVVSVKGGGERYVETTAALLRKLGDVEYATTRDLDRIDLDDFDVVHFTSTSANGLRPVKRPGGPRIAMTFHGTPIGLARLGWRTGRRGMYRAGQLAMYAREILKTNRVLLQLDAIVASSHPSADDLLRQAPFARRKLHVNELGVDTTMFHPKGARDDGFVLFVGRLERSKGVHTLIEGLGGTQHRVVVAGTGALRDELKERAGPNFELVGEVSDEELVDLYRRASVCVFPSLYEGFGLVALEALACGTPVAVSEAFAVRGPAAETYAWFPPEDAAALRAAVESQLGRKTPAFSEEAFRIVSEHHSAEAHARRLLELYEKLAAERPSR